jgi:hypothetical protein
MYHISEKIRRREVTKNVRKLKKNYLYVTWWRHVTHTEELRNRQELFYGSSLH